MSLAVHPRTSLVERQPFPFFFSLITIMDATTTATAITAFFNVLDTTDAMIRLYADSISVYPRVVYLEKHLSIF